MKTVNLSEKELVELFNYLKPDLEEFHREQKRETGRYYACGLDKTASLDEILLIKGQTKDFPNPTTVSDIYEDKTVSRETNIDFINNKNQPYRRINSQLDVNYYEGTGIGSPIREKGEITDIVLKKIDQKPKYIIVKTEIQVTDYGIHEQRKLLRFKIFEMK